MPSFSPSSLKRLESVHPDLQTLFHEVIKTRDCTVVSGLRTLEEQQMIYAKGRSLPGDIVTYKDGVNQRSKHQTGEAVDVIPYPEGYITYVMDEFGRYVLKVAERLKEEGLINHKITWGGFWKMRDRPHFQI